MLAPVDRSAAGHRRYAEPRPHLDHLITRLRATGMPIRDVRRYADLVRAGAGNETERLALLQAHRERVERPARRGDRPPGRHRPQDRALRRPARAGVPTPLTWSALEGR